MRNDLDLLLFELKQSLTNKSFVKISLGKSNDEKLIKISCSEVQLKDKIKIQFHYTFKTNDQVKNFTHDQAYLELEQLIGKSFYHINLFSTTHHLELKYNKKYKAKLFTKSLESAKSVVENDKTKKRLITENANNEYLQQLGVLSDEGKILKAKGDKYKQICRYVEIMSTLIDKAFAQKTFLKIADMGSGSGYLTFALTDYLTHFSDNDAQITGLELRPELVEKCNTIAEQCSYSNLQFEAGLIQDYENDIDVLIALHACDTATDDAILKGLKSQAGLIVCAPCCHKQIRKQLDSKITIPEILKHNIYQERFSEMLTDSIRALILEAYGYKTQVFEFIGSEHAGKNSMITAIKHDFNPNPDFTKAKALMTQFGIEEQALLGGIIL